MSNIQVRLCNVNQLAVGPSTGLPLANSIPVYSEFIATGTSSVRSTIKSEEIAGVLIWHIKAIGGDAWIKFGQSPVAKAGDDIHLSDGQVYECLATEANEMIAVIKA